MRIRATENCVVRSPEQAKEWFLAHAEGFVVCVKKSGDTTWTKLAETYPDARRFYEEEQRID